MRLDSNEIGTKYKSSKTCPQILLDTTNKHNINNFTFKRIRVITLNKPIADYPKDFLALLQGGDTSAYVEYGADEVPQVETHWPQ